MSEQLADLRTIKFLLHEVLNLDGLLQYPYYEDHSHETFDMAADTAYQLAHEVFWPSYQEFDQEGAQFDGKKVSAPAAMHEIWKQCTEGGWMAPHMSYEDGGQQFPITIHALACFLFNCGNTAAAMYLGLTYGAAHLIKTFGSKELQDRYMGPLLAGRFAGTMVLTEPDTGTSVGDMTTTASKSPDGGHWLMRGNKRFISGGDHDLTENIIHPVLARTEGAPPGIKGLSLFIVPKYRVNDDGSIGEWNDVTTTGIEHKLGLKGSATASLTFGDRGDCRAWLVGELNQGLKYMFELMNMARVFTGMQAVGVASAAYHCALEYARMRLQGRDITSRDPLEPQIPIIQHPDVRLMLLKQRAVVEGCLGLFLYCARVYDEEHAVTDPEEQQRLHLLLEMLTPCCKAYGSDAAFESIRLAIQCHGGSGYSEDYPVAQMLRDCKVFSIYEGANGIQALDLLGRKVPMMGGMAVQALNAEVGKTIAEAKALAPLKDLAEKIEALQNEVVRATMHLGMKGMSGEVHLFICNATAYLEMFSQLAISWQLLMQAVTAQKALDAGTTEENFYRGKIETARCYAGYNVPHAMATAQMLTSDERTALDFKPEWF